MFFKLARFELRYFLRQPSFIVTGLFFLLMPFFAMISDNVQIGGSSNVFFNAPHAITQTMLIMSLIGMFLVANFVGGTAVRDIAFKMDGMMLSTPLSKFDYLWGRLAGSTVFCLLVFLTVPLGLLIGSFWPTVDQERLGATTLLPYFWSYAIFVIPNFIFCSALFYVFALKARSMMGMYLGVVGFFILYELSGDLARNPEWVQLAALLDPFGFGAFMESTRFWTPFERNTQLVPFEGLLMWNRVLWLGVSFALVLITHLLIDVRRPKKVREKKSKKDKAPVPATSFLRVASTQSGTVDRNRFFTRVSFEMAQIIKSAPFIILCLFSLFSLLAIFFDSHGYYGTSNWPVTRDMAEYVYGSFYTMVLIVITYYAGESVWRERNIGIGDIVETTPIKNWTLYFPKVFALIAITVALTLVGLLFTVIYQVSKSYTDIEWSVYFGLLSLEFIIPTVMMTVLAIFIQVLSPNKYIGMLIFVGFFIANIVLSQLGLEHRMWSFARTPSLTYSDLNQYGHFLQPIFWYNVYWLGLSTIFIVLGYSLWPRGTEFALKYRIRSMASNMKGFGRLSATLGLLAFVGAGAVIYYNTRVLNTFITDDERMDLQAEYERKYSANKTALVPTITSVYAEVEFYPEQRKVITKGRYLLENKNAEPLKRVMLSWDAGDHRQLTFTVDGATELERNERYQTTWIEFEPALAVGAKTQMNFELIRANKGFVDNSPDNRVVANGSFVNNTEIMPRFGYNKSAELSDRHERRKRDLPAPERLPKLEDETQYGTNFIGPDADFIEFETIVSTSEDQVAIAPGYLQREWTENGRRYFHYKMDAPIFNYVAFLSGKWEITSAQHNGINIEVYHQPTHNMNVQRMIEATKDSLDYFGETFSPYQHRQVRIIEFPRYAQFAQSFSNTIPYSEDIGFLADLRSEDAIDYVYFVTAHEMAHQWWGHQVTPADVQGGAVLSETLAEYSAYMAMEKKLGKHKLRKFLKYEMDRYLRGRGREVIEEMPLYRAENQAYIHYQKGGVVMYSLRDRFGEDTINNALRQFLQANQYKADPYPNTLDLLRYLKAEIPSEGHAFVDELFQKITLFDLKIKEATAKPLPEGNYQVDMIIEASKYYADGQGEETAVELNDNFDIGLFSEDPDKAGDRDVVVYMQKHAITSGENKLSLIVDKLPAYVGVDPYITMIDRNSNDNLRKVTSQ